MDTTCISTTIFTLPSLSAMTPMRIMPAAMQTDSTDAQLEYVTVSRPMGPRKNAPL